MRSEYVVRPLHESDYDHWAQFVAQCRSGSIFALPVYLDILCQATGGSFEVTGVFQGNELVGGVALYFERQPLGLVATPRALLSYNGPVIRDYADSKPATRISRQAAILLVLRRYLNHVSCEELILTARHPISDIRPFIGGGWLVSPSYTYVVHIEDLPAAWARVDQNQRRLIERAENLGLVCTEDDDYDTFFRLHFAVHTRKKSRLYLPEAAYKQFLVRLRANNLCRLYHARLPDGQAAAAQLVLTGPHPVCHTVCAGSDANHLATGANPFLRWQVFTALAGLGYHANDLTGAPYPHETSRFKNQLGGTLVTNWRVSRTPTLAFRLRRKAYRLVRQIGRPVR